ncbi:Hrp-dependent type III effector protein [Pseudomonas sp. SDO528_S397]
MRLTTQHQPFAGPSSLYNGAAPTHRVPLNRVLTDPLGQAHPTCLKAVSPKEMDGLLVANQAIDDTWRILNRGSGNQQKQLRSTQGDSFKRTLVLRAETEPLGQDWPGIARAAALMQAGNCTEMAAVSALLATSTGIDQPVSIVDSPHLGHVVAQIGDARTADKPVIVDPWPEFGRALLREDFTLLDPEPQILHTYAPRSVAPQERNRLLHESKVTQRQVDEDFVKLYPGLPTGKDLLELIQFNMPGYAQQHGARNLGVRYQGADSQGRRHEVDQNLTQAQFQQRLVQLGIDPKTGAPVSPRPDNA